MNKYRLKRIKRYNEDYEENELDDQFVEGTINYFPEIGQSLQFILNQPDKGQLITTPLTVIKTLKPGLLILKTKNSMYHLKSGWAK